MGVYDVLVVTIFTLVASHQTVDLSTVAHLANGALELSTESIDATLRGLVVLSTCNRLEIYGETAGSGVATEQKTSYDVEQVSQAIFDRLAQTSGLDFSVVESSFDIFYDERATHHLFTVTAGLESAVVGEREITGQVRRAIATAQEQGEASGNLVRLFDNAAHTARRVGQQTLLGTRGRSIVSVALDLAHDVAEKTWDARSALIIGTGAYAGATVAALRERGCTEISVYSQSGRAATFADKRGILPVFPGHLQEAMSGADIIIGCSGSSNPLRVEDIPAGKHVILDLALTRDFAPEVADLPGVDLVTLESVRLAAPDETNSSVMLAHTIVDSSVAEFTVKEKARNVDAAIVALREHTMSILDSELKKVRAHYGCGAAADQVEMAMRRMAKSLLHTPTVRARALAKEGRESDYIAALEALYGIEVAPQIAQNHQEYPQADVS